MLKGARSTFGTSQHRSTEGTLHTRSRHRSFGYKKHPDNQSSITEGTLKNGLTSTSSPALDDYNLRSGSLEKGYFGVNTTVSYAVGAEHSTSASIPLEDMLAKASSSSSKHPPVGAEMGGIMRTMKVVTHSESVAAYAHTSNNFYCMSLAANAC